MSRKSIPYTSSPLLTSRTPVWRSKLIVAAVAFGFRMAFMCGSLLKGRPVMAGGGFRTRCRERVTVQRAQFG